MKSKWPSLIQIEQKLIQARDFGFFNRHDYIYTKKVILLKHVNQFLFYSQ